MPSYLQILPLRILNGLWSSDSSLLTLIEPKSKMCVPLVVGPMESQAIILTQEEYKTVRPTTHELLLNVIHASDATLKRIAIEKMMDGVFYASLTLDYAEGERCVDCRASDAVVMSLMTDTPILIERKLLQEVGSDFDTFNGKIDGNESEDETHDREKPCIPHEAPSIEDLERRLKECEEREDYDQAATILEIIQEMQKKKD